jgi:archaellum component FlaG (FlaF/FlaG flagellin family)
MSKIRLLLTGLVLILFAQSLRASHAAGGYFEYTCLGNNQYEISFFFLRDCKPGSDEAPEDFDFSIRNACNVPCYTVNAPSVYHSVADFGCGSNCDGWFGNTVHEGAPSFELYQYRTTVTLPSQCTEWTISVTEYERNNTDFAGSGNYYNYCTINNSTDICVSSANIGGLPFAIGCVNKVGITKYAATAATGTTLQYQLVDPLSGACDDGTFAVAHEGATSALRPCPSQANWAPADDGRFVYVPTMTGLGYFAVRITARDASGVIVSEQVVDGIVFTSNNCDNGAPLTFNGWTESGNSIITTSSISDLLCGSFTIQSNDGGESVQLVNVQTPAFMTHTIAYNEDGTATVNVCADIPDESLCSEETWSITVTGFSSDAGCTAIASGSVGSTGYYYIKKTPTAYCPENMYITNRNDLSGIPAPLNARAEERIWVGDAMPSGYLPQYEGFEGPVVVPNNAHYIAGLEIILPSCEDAQNTCVTLEGGMTLEIKPNSCSPECPRDPLAVQVDEIFRCGSEQLSVNAQGEGPFTYQLIFLGDTILQDFAVFSIHDLISELDNGQNPYTINVFDAIGGQGTFSGEVLGTKRLYEPITDNTIYMDYPDGHIYDDGFYYAGNLVVQANGPFFLWDDVNTTGPWYGATYMKFTIWDRWGSPQENLVHYYERDLEDGTDWSFNNYEIFWNGHWWNDTDNPCAMAGAQILTYTLTAKNCYTVIHEEIDACGIDDCFDGEYIPMDTKSTNQKDDEVWYFPGENMRENVTVSAEEDGTRILCYPNPASAAFTIRSMAESILSFEILNGNGGVIYRDEPNAVSVEINAEMLSSGMYTISVTTETGEKHVKFVKN